MIEYIKSLGVTTVELLPIHTFINDSHLLEKRPRPTTGATTRIGFFAPDPRYAADRANCLREFKEMVARFHDAGLEVILDVVYNHTAEGNERGPTLSFKGIDNASYYRLMPDQQRYYINDTGTGNTLEPQPPARDPDGDRQPALLGDRDARRRLPLRPRRRSSRASPTASTTQSGFLEGRAARIRCSAAVKLIAEPWDCGPGGYQVGGFPPGWAEWNDQFRDTVRDFWRGEAPAAALAPRLCASPRHVQPSRPPAVGERQLHHRARRLHAERPRLLQREAQRGERRGQPATAHSDNRSWNCGVEGPTDDPAINALRERQMRNMLATLLLSQGTPMMLAGDEFGRTQQGNNNAYCQDNEISWVDWERATRRDER